jgi:DNA mismatch endonuclease (patch repair protein)
LKLRSAIFRLGLRYRVNARPIPGIRRSADVVFPRLLIAVFVDGCFWHGCPEHGTWPRANADFWREKILQNRQRDRDTDRRLRRAGWAVIRVWEHEDMDSAAERVLRAVHQRRVKIAMKARAARRSTT